MPGGLPWSRSRRQGRDRPGVFSASTVVLAHRVPAGRLVASTSRSTHRFHRPPEVGSRLQILGQAHRLNNGCAREPPNALEMATGGAALLQVFLVIFLGAIERSGGCDFGGDRTL